MNEPRDAYGRAAAALYIASAPRRDRVIDGEPACPGLDGDRRLRSVRSIAANRNESIVQRDPAPFQRAWDGHAASPGRTLTNGVTLSVAATDPAAPPSDIRLLAAAAFRNARLSIVEPSFEMNSGRVSENGNSLSISDAFSSFAPRDLFWRGISGLESAAIEAEKTTGDKIRYV